MKTFQVVDWDIGEIHRQVFDCRVVLDTVKKSLNESRVDEVLQIRLCEIEFDDFKLFVDFKTLN